MRAHTHMHNCLIPAFQILWISDHLTCREQLVVVNRKSSQYSPVISGVPQDSVAGPLLFLIYVDGLAKLTLSEMEAIWYFKQMIHYCFDQSGGMRIFINFSMTSHWLITG